MSETIHLYEIPGSPNNMKVRLGMNFKEIPFERHPLPAGDGEFGLDRSEVIRISRQSLTPTIRHGDVVLFDSAAILRYLEANFRETRPLFSPDRAVMKAIEGWELAGNTRVAEPVGIAFAQALAPDKDLTALARASEMLHAATAPIEERLAEGRWLVGDDLTAADVTVAPWVFYGMTPPEIAAAGPIQAFFHEHLHLGEGRERTREWCARVMAYDR